MNIEVIGLNHRSAPIEIREKLAFSKSSLEEALIRLKSDPQIQESVILSTCNRVEIYARGVSGERLNGKLSEFLSNFHKIKNDSFEKSLYSFSGRNALRHLFLVSSSLDSQVLGENQILGQVKEAYFKAKQTKAISRIFSFLFEEAIKVGKQARTQTLIGYGAVSLSTAAVEMAKKIFESLSGKTVLIIGAGKIGELSASHLYGRGAKMLMVANRTFSNAERLAKKLNGKAITFDKFPEALIEADIVISSVSAPHFLVKKDMMDGLMIRRKFRPIFFIDLGLPRNIDPLINSMENIYIYNLDDLKRIKDANLQDRLKEAKKIEHIIDERLLKVESKLQELLHVEE